MDQFTISHSTFFDTVIPSLTSCITCIWLFFNYRKLVRKTVALRMILILSISDFIFHVLTLMVDFQTEAFNKFMIGHTLNFALSFSSAWPAAIAYLAYSSLKQRFSDPYVYYKWSIILIPLISLVLTFM